MQAVTRFRFSRFLRQEVVGQLLWSLAPGVYWVAYLWRRLLWRTTFVAVTGSHGKTTAKECIAAILATRARTAKSYRNQNSGLLLSLSVLRVRPWHRFAVIEVGVAAPGAMPRAARLVRPDVAVVTVIRRSHTTEFPDLDHYAAEKERLVSALSPGGTAVRNADDPRVAVMTDRAQCRVVLHGRSPRLAVWADGIAARWPDRLSFVGHVGQDEECRVVTNFVGEHWVPAVLAALATAYVLGVPLAGAAEALTSVQPSTARMQPATVPCGATFLRDDVNGTMDACTTAFQVFAEARAERRIVVVRDASDCGSTKRRDRLAHLGREAARVGDCGVFVGDNAHHAAKAAVRAGLPEARVHTFTDLRAAAEFLRAELRAGDLVLLKGRNCDHLGRLYFAQFGEVRCWKDQCHRLMECDVCWELGSTARRGSG